MKSGTATIKWEDIELEVEWEHDEADPDTGWLGDRYPQIIGIKTPNGSDVVDFFSDMAIEYFELMLRGEG